jgi:hypothetical protein
MIAGNTKLGEMLLGELCEILSALLRLEMLTAKPKARKADSCLLESNG